MPREPEPAFRPTEPAADWRELDANALNDDVAHPHREIVQQNNVPDSHRRGSRDDEDDVTVPKKAAPASFQLDLPDDLADAVDEAEEADQREGSSDDDAKRPNCFARAFNKLVPPGGLLSSAFNLASATLGAGILGLPSAFHNMGLAMGLITLVIATSLIIFSIWLLARCVIITKQHTYAEVVNVLLGRWAAYFIAVILVLNSFGAGVSYIITMNDILLKIFDHPTVPAFLRSDHGRRLMVSLFWLVLIWPLCLPRKITSLRFSSVVGCSCMIFFVICVVVNSSTYFHEEGFRSEVRAFNTGNGVIVGLGPVLFSVLVSMNVPEVCAETNPLTTARMLRNGIVGMSSCAFLYVVVGVFGYGRFGDDMTGSLILMYQPREYPVFWAAFIGVIIKICVAFAVHQIPLRDSVYYFFKLDAYKINWFLNAALCTFFALAILVLGLFVPTLNTVLGLCGSFCGGFIGFIYPALMVMYCGNWHFRTVGAFEYIATYVLLIVGVVAAVWGTAATIWELF